MEAAFISLVCLAATWLAGKAWSRAVESKTLKLQQRLDTIERWARKAAVLVAPLVKVIPAPLTSSVETFLSQEVKSIASRVGLTLTDSELRHAIEVAHEFLLTLQMSSKPPGT